LGIASTLATWALAARHVSCLKTAPISLLRGKYCLMMVYPCAWATSALLTLLCPRSSLLSELIRGQSEAAALFWFLQILIMIVSVESMKNDSNDTDHVGQTILRALNADGEKPHFAVPPFFCCFAGVFPRHSLDAKLLLRVVWLVRQFVMLQFGLSIFNMWATMAWPARLGNDMKMVASGILKVSGLTAVYGLFVMYKATHNLLEHWHTTKKFISIKCVIFISLLQSLCIHPLLQHVQRPENKCLKDPTDPDNLDMVAEHYIATLLSVEAMVMAYLVSSAFPVSELRDQALVHHMDVVEMSLGQLHEQEGGSNKEPLLNN